MRRVPFQLVPAFALTLAAPAAAEVAASGDTGFV